MSKFDLSTPEMQARMRALALRAYQPRAGHAGQAIGVDTRPKKIDSKKHKALLTQKHKKGYDRD